MIAKICLWDNLMIMAFDKSGQQIPDYQGPISEVREKLLLAYDNSTKFYMGQWRGPSWEVSRNYFEQKTAHYV